MNKSPQGKQIYQEVAIHTNGLTRLYGEVEALVDLDLSVPFGSIFGYLGRNGAGKTTTIRLLTGLARPTRGQAWVAGYETTSLNNQAKRLIGYLPQEPGFYAWMRGREFLTYITRLFGLTSAEGKNEVERVLEVTKLAEVSNRKIGSYSSGEKQRLAIAQALIGTPPVLILDEPTSSLDPSGRRELLETIGSLRGEVTVFFSSHILADVERVCDTIAVIHKGRLILVSEKKQLLEEYAVNAACLELDDSSLPFRPEILEDFESRDWVNRVTIEGNLLNILANDVQRGKEELLAIVVKHDLHVVRYEWVRPSLEDIFLKISN